MRFQNSQDYDTSVFQDNIMIKEKNHKRSQILHKLLKINHSEIKKPSFETAF